MIARAARRVLWIACVCLVIARPSAADGRPILADFDGDGVHDRATLVGRETAPAVQVWLSSTDSSTLLRFPTPISRIAAADVDGDRRDELIGASTSADLSVWTLREQRFQLVPPRPAPVGLAPHTPLGVGDDEPDVPGEAIPGTSEVRATLTGTARPRAPAVAATPVPRLDADARSAFPASPYRSRPPPPSR